MSDILAIGEGWEEWSIPEGFIIGKYGFSYDGYEVTTSLNHRALITPLSLQWSALEVWGNEVYIIGAKSMHWIKRQLRVAGEKLRKARGKLALRLKL